MKKSYLKKLIKEIVKESVLEKLTTRSELDSGTMNAVNLENTEEMIQPDGRYGDDMESGVKSRVMSGIDENEDTLPGVNEESSTGGVAGYATPFAFSRKNKMGSPKAIAAAKKYGKVVKSISEEV